jgi:hypothetical protein
MWLKMMAVVCLSLCTGLVYRWFINKLDRMEIRSAWIAGPALIVSYLALIAAFTAFPIIVFEDGPRLEKHWRGIPILASFIVGTIPCWGKSYGETCRRIFLRAK